MTQSNLESPALGGGGECHVGNCGKGLMLQVHFIFQLGHFSPVTTHKLLLFPGLGDMETPREPQEVWTVGGKGREFLHPEALFSLDAPREPHWAHMWLMPHH